MVKAFGSRETVSHDRSLSLGRGLGRGLRRSTLPLPPSPRREGGNTTVSPDEISAFPCQGGRGKLGQYLLDFFWRQVTVQRVQGDHFKAGEHQLLDLASDVDVVLMRQDPPFDIGYITATYLLERVASDTLVVNDPRAVRDAPEKLFVLDFAEFM